MCRSLQASANVHSEQEVKETRMKALRNRKFFHSIFQGFAVFFFLGLSRLWAQSTPGNSTLFTIDARTPAAAPETGYLEMGSADAGQSPSHSTLSVNSRTLVLDGKPWLPVMGEFHYSRFPQQYWEEEILKMKAGGIQIIATYVFWIHHEEIEGTFDWTGQRDLRKFVELCGKHGLDVYPRIGPWAHGEVHNGGFPDWLLTKCPTRVNDSTFLSAVRTFYDEIGKQLKGLLWKDGGPVIGIQIENEYANRAPNGGEKYLLKLKSMAIEAGLDVPLYTVTGWDNAVIPPHAFVPVYGGYPDEPWSGSTRELQPDPQGVYQFHVATPVGTAGILQGVTSRSEVVEHSHYPRFTAEMGGGVEITYHRRVVVSPDDIAAMTLSALGSGVNLIGYYMYHGGANPDGRLTTLQESQATDYPNDLPVISYDFQAPLGEFGEMNGTFRKLKVIHQFIHDFGSSLDTMTAFVPDVLPSGPRDTTTLRVSARSDGSHAFLFFNNYLRNYPLPEQKNVQVKLNLASGTISIPSEPIDIPSQTYCSWPVNLDLHGALLKYTTAEPFATLADWQDSYYFFTTSPKINAEFVFDASTVDSLQSGSGDISRSGGRIFVRKVGSSTSDAIVVKPRGGNTVHIVVLTPDMAENAWKLRLGGHEHMLITKASVFAADDTIYMRSRDPNSFSMSITPKLTTELTSNVILKKTEDDGIFTHYVASVKEENIAVSLSQVRKPGAVPPVRMGKVVDWRNCAVASSPDDSSFEKAGIWRITLPETMPSSLSDVFLDINYTGDVGRLYGGKQFLDDNFYNGTSWEVGLKRYGRSAWPNGLSLKILPLRKDAPIYIPQRMWPAFKGAAQVGEVKSVKASPEYEVTLTVGSEPLSQPQLREKGK